VFDLILMPLLLILNGFILFGSFTLAPDDFPTSEGDDIVSLPNLPNKNAFVDRKWPNAFAIPYVIDSAFGMTPLILSMSLFNESKFVLCNRNYSIRCQGAMRHRLRHDAVPQDFLHSLRPANDPVGLHQNQQIRYHRVGLRIRFARIVN
jgi:hypothetical protein